jgi:hypothetical protein
LYGTAFANAIKIFWALQCTIRLMAERANPAHTVHSEARGGHWVAWIPDANGKPEQSVVLVGETREEAEDRARQWGERRAPR